MVAIDAGTGTDVVVAEDLARLRRQMSDSRRKADDAARAYERRAWITYGLIFVPIPFVVLLLRFHLEAWGYYVAGALFVAALVAGYATDLAAVSKRDRLAEAAERAREAYEAAADRSQRIE